MKRLQHISLLAGALVLVGLAGCSKEPAPAPAAVPTPQMTRDAVPTVSRDQLAYYTEHLDEARGTWRQCQQLKESDITDEIRARCNAAQSAWETQPYKPRSRK